MYMVPETFILLYKPQMGGVNHCCSHCRLGNFRDLMIGGKYGAVIGFKYKPIAWKLLLGTYKKKRFHTNHSPISPRSSYHGILPANDSVNYGD